MDVKTNMESVDIDLKEENSSTNDPIKMDPDVFKAHLSELITSGDVLPLKKLFLDDWYRELIVNLVWDLVHIFSLPLTEENETNNPDLIDFCAEALDLMAEQANAKEVLIVLMEEVDTFLVDVKFKVLLRVVQKALLRIKTKRNQSLRMSLEATFTHLEVLRLPEDIDADSEEEKILYDLDPNVICIVENLNLYLDFIQPFVEDIPQDEELTDDQKVQRDILLVALMKILSMKLAYLYLDSESETKSAVWRCCERVMKFCARLCRDFYKGQFLVKEVMFEEYERQAEEKALNERMMNADSDTLDDNQEPRPSDDSPYPHVSQACFQYLIYVEMMTFNRLPGVLNHNHVFVTCLPSIALMLSSPRPVIVDKGAKLALNILDYLPLQEFPRDMVEVEHFKAFVENLLQAVVMCPSKNARACCLKIFPRILNKFDARGKHSFFIFAFTNTGHGGLKGHLLQLLKDEIVQSFDTCDNDYMTITRVKQVVNLLFKLPDGPESDLLEHSDLIISNLNFLRYLVIRDISNKSGIWDLIPMLQQQYFQPLQKSLDLSKAHFEMEYEACLRGKSACDNIANTGIDYKVTVGSSQLPVSMPKEQQISILRGAIFTFDMITNLLTRVDELVENGENTRQNAIAEDMKEEDVDSDNSLD